MSKYKLTSGSSFESVMVDAYCYDIKIIFEEPTCSCVILWQDSEGSHGENVPIFKTPERVQAIMDAMDTQPNGDTIRARAVMRRNEYRKQKNGAYARKYAKEGGEK